MSETRQRQPLHPGFQVFVEDIAAAQRAGAPRWNDLTMPELRALTRDIRKGAAPVTGLTRTDLEVDGHAGTLPARLFVPDGSAEIGPGLVYFHGGGFCIGSVDTHDGIASHIAVSSGVRVISIDYRLGPEHRFPAAHDDALASSKFVFANARSLGFDPARIAIGGDSAGANLAAATCLALRAASGPRPRFQLLLYPNTTIRGREGSRALYAEDHYLTLAGAFHLFDNYVDDVSATNPRIDLLAQTDLTGLAATFLSVGHCDILFDECADFARNLMADGVPLTLRTYPGYIHGFYGFPDRVPAVLDAFRHAGQALAEALAPIPAEG